MCDYVHFSFEDYIHFVTWFAFLENCVTGFKGDEVIGIPKKMTELHGDYLDAHHDEYQVGFWRESGASSTATNEMIG